jgi:hypothetical protein
MPITSPSGPSDGPQIVSRNISAILASQPRGGWGLLRDVPTKQIFLADPHPVFVVGLEDLAHGELLGAAKPVAWRYLVFAGQDAVAEAELTYGPSRGATSKFLALHESPFAQASVTALSLVERRPGVRRGTFELRFLKAPAVYFAALWLSGERRNILVPLREPRGRLRNNTAYTERRVLTALEPSVKQAQAFDSRFNRKRPRRR